MMAQPRNGCLRLAAQLQQRARSRLRYRSYATVTSALKPGDQLHGFSVKRTKYVPELELTAYHLEHDKTGAEYLHVARDDSNNVFSIGFKTNPPDHTGVPHILEHLVLCGSQGYPVRDPFFKMMPRSLSNFMNAMTYPDHTVYPFATTNPQDFKNLLSVYLDATLHPLLRPLDFAQEGWRIGPANAQAQLDAADAAPVFKGVVYNEMKGAMSNSDDLFATRWRDHVFPSINNSGGVPQKMTNLTHEELVQFHSTHYHPSNAKLFTYGNFPLDDHLRQIGPQLDKFDRIIPETDVRDLIKLNDGPQQVTVKGPVDPLFPVDQQYKSSLSWMMSDTSNITETFSLSLISSVLLDGFSAPLYVNTIGVGSGASYSVNTGFDTSAKTAIFSVGLNGQKKSDVGRLKDGIRNTLLSVRRNGISRDKVDARLHQVELALKHKTAQFGMGLMSRLQDGWFNGIDPFSTVAPEETIAAFKTQYDRTGYLENLLKKYWLHENTFEFVMEPSETFERELVEEESKRLASKLSGVFEAAGTPEKGLSMLHEQETKLVEDQSKPEDLDCLPSVHVKDIPREHQRKEVRMSQIGETKVQWREAPTNGITYVRGILQFKDLPDELRMCMPLYSAAIHRLGTKTMPVETLEDLINLRTGGISVGSHSSNSPFDLDVSEEGISFSTNALDRNVDEMFDLLRVLIQETNFEHREAEEQIGELIKAAASSGMNEIADGGSRYAQIYAEAGISPQSTLMEQVSGLTQVRLMMDLVSRGQQAGYKDVIEYLKAIQSFALAAGPSLRIAVTCDPSSSAANEAALQKFLSKLPPASAAPLAEQHMSYPAMTKTFFDLPYQVFYTGRALRTVPYTHPDSAKLKIVSELLTHKHVHQEIREKGGAYGGGAYASGLRGIFGYTSYRDPNPLNSLKIMNGCGEVARERNWTEQDLEEAKLSLFQHFDAPESVSQEGMSRFLMGIDDDMEQEHRTRLLDVTVDDVKQAADKYLVGKEGQGKTAVLGKTQDWVSEENGWISLPMSGGDSSEKSRSEDGEGILIL